jgi:hypothetical protein
LDKPRLIFKIKPVAKQEPIVVVPITIPIVGVELALVVITVEHKCSAIAVAIDKKMRNLPSISPPLENYSGLNFMRSF